MKTKQTSMADLTPYEQALRRDVDESTVALDNAKQELKATQGDLIGTKLTLQRALAAFSRANFSAYQGFMTESGLVSTEDVDD